MDIWTSRSLSLKVQFLHLQTLSCFFLHWRKWENFEKIHFIHKTQVLSFLNYVITETFISTKANEIPHKIPDELCPTWGYMDFN